MAAGFWSLVARSAGVLATFILGIILARLLGPDELGIYGVVVALALVLSVIAQAGLPTLATRDISVALARAEWPLLRGVLQGFGAFIVVTTLGLAAAEAVVVLSWPKLFAGAAAAYIWGSLLVPLFALTVLVSAELRALGRLVAGQSLDTLIRPSILIVCCILVYLVGRSLTASFAVALNAFAALVALLFGTALLIRAVPAQVRRAVPDYRARLWKRAAFPLALVDWLRQVDASYGMLLVGILASDVDAGYFRLAFSVSISIAAPITIFHQVLAPTVAQYLAGAERDRLQRLLRTSAVSIFAVAAIEFIVVALVGRQIISFVFGSRYADAWLPLLLLAGAQVVNGFFGIVWIILAMGGGERQLTVSFVVSVATSIASAIVLGTIWGMPGIAAASIIGALVQNVIAWSFVRKRYGIEGSLLAALRTAH